MSHAPHCAAALLVSALALGGCSSAPAPAHTVSLPKSSPTSAQPAIATLSGTVRLYGGPIRPDGKMGLNGNPVKAVTPVVVKQSGRIADRSSTNLEGWYTVQLPAGSYSLSAGCSQSVPVVLHAGERLVRDLPCYVP
jgi:hypothetical protein